MYLFLLWSIISFVVSLITYRVSKILAVDLDADYVELLGFNPANIAHTASLFLLVLGLIFIVLFIISLIRKKNKNPLKTKTNEDIEEKLERLENENQELRKEIEELKDSIRR